MRVAMGEWQATMRVEMAPRDALENAVAERTARTCFRAATTLLKAVTRRGVMGAAAQDRVFFGVQFAGPGLRWRSPLRVTSWVKKFTFYARRVAAELLSAARASRRCISQSGRPEVRPFGADLLFRH